MKGGRGREGKDSGRKYKVEVCNTARGVIEGVGKVLQ